jgi:hypothetical protein
MTDQLFTGAQPYSTWEGQAKAQRERILLLEQILFDVLDSQSLMASDLYDLEEAFKVSEGQARFIRDCARDHRLTIPEKGE